MDQYLSLQPPARPRKSNPISNFCDNKYVKKYIHVSCTKYFVLSKQVQSSPKLLVSVLLRLPSVQLLSVVWFTRQHAANKTVLIQRRNSCKLKCARDRPHWKPTQAACVISIYTVSTQYLHNIYTVSIQYLPSIYNDLSPAVTTLHWYTALFCSSQECDKCDNCEPWLQR